MACLNSTYPLTGTSAEMCDGNIGGVKVVYGALKDEVVIASAATSGETTATTAYTVTVSAKASGEKPFREFAFRKNTASMTSTENIDTDNLTQYVTTELVMQFKRMDSDKRMAMMALLKNDCVFVVEDMNGKQWLLGYDDPVIASAGSANTGTQKSDSNYYEITMYDESKELPYEVRDFDPTALVK